MNLKEKTHYEECEFNDLSCREEFLTAKTFQECAFVNCDFSGCNFGGSKFVECSFSGCNWSLTKLAGTRMQGVSFTDCKFVGVNFSEIDPMLLDWSFTRSVCKTCNFSGLQMKGSFFKECSISETYFSETNLRGGAFTDCDLSGSVFHNSDLREVDFCGAINIAIDPRVNRIEKAKFSAAEALSLLSCFAIEIE